MGNISVTTGGTFNYKAADKKGNTVGLFNFDKETKEAYYGFVHYYHLAHCEQTIISFLRGIISGPEKGVGIGK